MQYFIPSASVPVELKAIKLCVLVPMITLLTTPAAQLLSQPTYREQKNYYCSSLNPNHSCSSSIFHITETEVKRNLKSFSKPRYFVLYLIHSLIHQGKFFSAFDTSVWTHRHTPGSRWGFSCNVEGGKSCCFTGRFDPHVDRTHFSILRARLQLM